MPRKLLFNYLELAFSPICNYDFSIIKEDELFQSFIKKSTLYIISQRKELTIDAFRPEFELPNQVILHFEIRQKGNPSVLTCSVPAYQSNLAFDSNRELKFHIEYALPKPNPIPKNYPQNNIRTLLLYYHDDTFISWLNPENFIQNYLNGAVEAKVIGSIKDFLNYKVHYVGKATEQDVWKRLTGHSTMQEILSEEYPLHFGTLPTHEISILFFKFKDAIGVHTIRGREDITKDAIDAILGKNQPDGRTISLDAEKALISAMQPKYNKQFYKNYPKSTDGLYKYGLDQYSFQIQSNITLLYENGIINGSSDLFADSIVVKKGEPLRVINNS